MARSRTIKPSFFTNEELAELSRDVRLFFEGLWIIADREGRLENRPKRIKREVFPYDEDFTEATVGEWLTILANSRGRFVSLYEVDGEKYIQIKNFKKHQDIHPREKPSEIPVQPKADPVPAITGQGQPNPEPAGELNLIIPLPSVPSCTSVPSASSLSQVLEASDPDPERARVERLPQRKLTGHDLLSWFGSLRREVLRLQSAPGTERPRDPNGKAGAFAESLSDADVADVKPTMRLALERIRDGVPGWNDPRTVDPSFAFGAWKSGFAGLREAIHGLAPKAPSATHGQRAQRPWRPAEPVKIAPVTPPELRGWPKTGGEVSNLISQLAQEKTA